ncbi:MAG TPA: RNA polymerase sigma factor [Steroidobacteraceae bacterium]|jgi:RNA polymerase sigma factor (sigma-70 family)
MEALGDIHSPMTLEQNQSIVADVKRERPRLLQFIRRHVIDERDADDILQEVFFELTEARRLTKPIEQVGAWLFRVARNRITDRFRARRREMPLPHVDTNLEEPEPTLESLLPDADAGPEAAFARRVLLEEIFIALDELPAAQREIFVAHEIEGRSFKQMADASGTSINTLLARKHDAVRYLRRRLRIIFDEYSESGSS